MQFDGFLYFVEFGLTAPARPGKPGRHTVSAGPRRAAGSAARMAARCAGGDRQRHTLESRVQYTFHYRRS